MSTAFKVFYKKGLLIRLTPTKLPLSETLLLFRIYLLCWGLCDHHPAFLEHHSPSLDVQGYRLCNLFLDCACLVWLLMPSFETAMWVTNQYMFVYCSAQAMWVTNQYMFVYCSAQAWAILLLLFHYVSAKKDYDIQLYWIHIWMLKFWQLMLPKFNTQ